MPKSCVRPPHRLSSLIARGPLSTALAVVAALLLTPLVSPTARLVAQSCPFNHQCFANAPPTIAIYPHTATVSAASYPLIIYMTDDWKLDLTQFYFYKKGVAQSVTVTSTQPTAASGAVTIMLDSGVNMLVAQVKDDKGLLAVDTAYLTYIPPPPRWQPTLQLTAHHNEFRPSAPCPSCTATVAYSTPSYVTLDAPRSLTLAYSSATASPIGLVQIDATITSGTQPQWVSLKLRKPSGAYVTFANGTQEVFYQPDPGWTTRLAAQFDASDSADWPTGAYNLTAVVWASYSGTTYFDEANVRVLIVNERKSPIGAGVSWLGVPRLTENSAPNDAGVTLTVGDGSAVFYKQSSCYQDSCNYYLPAGIFSILQSSSTQYVLQGRDGSTIAFRKSATNANTSGLPLYVKDRFGNQTSFTWDTTVTPARLTTVTDPAGQTITVQYSSTAPRGGTVSITEHALGRTSTVTYNADSTLYSVQNPSPQSRKPLIAQYDAKHRLLSYTDDMLQATRSFTYDSSGWVRTVATTPSGGSAITTRIKSLPDTLLPRPGRGMYSSTADPGLSPDKAVTVIAGPASDSTRGSFDRFGLPLRVDVRDPAGRVQSTAWTRNTVGQVTSVRDPQYLITSYHYVSSTPLVDTVSQDGSKTVIQYGRLIRSRWSRSMGRPRRSTGTAARSPRSTAADRGAPRRHSSGTRAGGCIGSKTPPAWSRRRPSTRRAR